MITNLQKIKILAEDIRLNPYNTKEIAEYKLRLIEDICIKSIILLNEHNNRNN